MATAPINNFFPTDNNGGTIKANGTLSGTFESASVVQPKVDVFASTVLDNNDTDKAIGGGTFAFNNNQPIAKKVTKSLSNVQTNVLLSGAGNPGGIRSIHKIESIKTRKLTKALRDGRFNSVDGKFDAGYPEISDDVFYNISSGGITVDNEPIDDAANPTRLVPGELTYRTGSSTPKMDNYKEKTNY